MSQILIDGVLPSIEDLTHQALVNYGAFTSFRVEDGGVRGLDLHLARLDAAAVTLFGEAVGEARLRDLMRIAVAGQEACWLRVSLFSDEIRPRSPSWRGVPRVMTVVSPPPSPLAVLARLRVQTHVRYQPNIKHTAMPDLIQARRTAREAGFDDALFADSQGLISEGSSWNIGFVQGDRVIWPLAPMLSGVTQVLIDEGLGAVGLTSETRPVRVADIADFDQAFLCNSATPACAVSIIGDVGFEEDPALIERISAAWASGPVRQI